VKGFMGDDQLAEALEGADLVIIPAGVPRKPGMTRDDLFNINAGIVKNLCTAIAKYCPNVRFSSLFKSGSVARVVDCSVDAWSCYWST
jgi:malate/lactate dehydrogenase